MKNNQLDIPEGWSKETLGKKIMYEQPYRFIVKSTNYEAKSGTPVLTAGKSFILGYTHEVDNIYKDTPVIIFDDFTTDTKYVEFPFKVKSSAMKFLKAKNENDVELKFIFEKLQTLKITETGGDHKRRWISEFSKIEILFPSFKEQEKIAAILSKVDKAIAETEALIAKYNRIKTGLMQDLLTKGIDENGIIRSEATHEFKDSPLGRIPKEWECDLLDDCCYVTKLAGYEFTKHMKYKDDGEVIALRALNIKNEKLILDDVQRISQSVSDFLIRSKLFKGDILVTYIGAYIGDVVQIRENDKYHLAPNIAKIVTNKKLVPDFLEIVLRTEKVQKQFKALITTTANPSLTMGQIRKTYILFPIDIKEQVLIIEKIHSFNKSKDILNTQLSKLQSLKTGLMQDLLSGKVRVV